MAGAVYGEMLAFFPEQFVSVVSFQMEALMNDNYGPRTDVRTLRGVIQNKLSSIKDSNGNLVQINTERFWYKEKLVNGSFIEYQGTVYRLISDNEWPLQGGFYQYVMDKIVGSDGTGPADADWNTGEGSFA